MLEMKTFSLTLSAKNLDLERMIRGEKISQIYLCAVALFGAYPTQLQLRSKKRPHGTPPYQLVEQVVDAGTSI